MGRVATGQVGEANETGRKRWLALYGPIAAELAAAEKVLREQLVSDDPFVDSLVKHAFRLGGKRLRPALLLATAQAAGGVQPEHIILSAVVEMIHTATLVHDDVLDEATLRRHRETINARCDNEVSVLVGDFLFTHSFFLASSLPTTYGCRAIGHATNVVCAGELRQIHSRGNFALTEGEYLDIIDAKTAELCACCCRLGAHYAGASPDVEESLERYGRSLGIAFQIADDLLDVLGDERTAGKSLGTDLEKQKPTLPVIRLLAKASVARREPLLALLRSGVADARAQVLEALRRSDALDYAREKALVYSRQACEELDCLPPGPARDLLMQLTQLVVSRRE